MNIKVRLSARGRECENKKRGVGGWGDGGAEAEKQHSLPLRPTRGIRRMQKERMAWGTHAPARRAGQDANGMERTYKERMAWNSHAPARTTSPG